MTSRSSDFSLFYCCWKKLQRNLSFFGNIYIFFCYTESLQRMISKHLWSVTHSQNKSFVRPFRCSDTFFIFYILCLTFRCLDTFVHILHYFYITFTLAKVQTFPVIIFLVLVFNNTMALFQKGKYLILLFGFANIVGCLLY